MLWVIWVAGFEFWLQFYNLMYVVVQNNVNSHMPQFGSMRRVLEKRDCTNQVLSFLLVFKIVTSAKIGSLCKIELHVAKVMPSILAGDSYFNDRKLS